MKPHPKNDLLHLLLILEAIEKIFIYSKASREANAFFDLNDGLEFNACLMQLIQIGEQANKLSNELKDKYPQANWKEIQGFRNRATHDYTGRTFI